jgi:hypothetical protein
MKANAAIKAQTVFKEMGLLVFMFQVIQSIQ